MHALPPPPNLVLMLLPLIFVNLFFPNKCFLHFLRKKEHHYVNINHVNITRYYTTSLILAFHFKVISSSSFHLNNC